VFLFCENACSACVRSLIWRQLRFVNIAETSGLCSDDRAYRKRYIMSGNAVCQFIKASDLLRGNGLWSA
jgi:hypothetical protein